MGKYINIDLNEAYSKANTLLETVSVNNGNKSQPRAEATNNTKSAQNVPNTATDSKTITNKDMNDISNKTGMTGADKDTVAQIQKTIGDMATKFNECARAVINAKLVASQHIYRDYMDIIHKHVEMYNGKAGSGNAATGMQNYDNAKGQVSSGDINKLIAVTTDAVEELNKTNDKKTFDATAHDILATANNLLTTASGKNPNLSWGTYYNWYKQNMGSSDDVKRSTFNKLGGVATDNNNNQQ